MASVRNLLVLFHGITIEDAPTTETIDRYEYDPLVAGINGALPDGREFREEDIIRAYWGFPNPRAFMPFAGEQALSAAEVHAGALCPDGHDVGDYLTMPVASAVAGFIKRRILRAGLADAVYYASAEGEFQVRWSVFGQILYPVLRLLADPAQAGVTIRLHLVAHSLGATVASDLAHFLFGYRGTQLEEAGFFNPPRTLALAPEQVGQLADYHARLTEPGLFDRLRFGSFTSIEGQLPLFVFRRQRDVEALAGGAPPFDAAAIGVDLAADRLQLQFIHVPNDILGFPGLALYRNDTGGTWGRRVIVRPRLAQLILGPLGYSRYHTSSWRTPRVHRSIAELIRLNA